MKLGPLIRRLLPAGLETMAAKAYRAVFVDLDKVALQLAKALPGDANVLDIGGGDGELLNRLLAMRTDVRVTMVDIAPSVGRFLLPQYRERVRLLPGTTIQAHLLTLHGQNRKYDAAIVVDVMHHIPGGQRESFLGEVHEALAPGGVLLIKDVEPGHLRATLGYLCDRYISGDRGVALISITELSDLVARIAPGRGVSEVGLLQEDRPNYLIRIGAA
jgi:cyclopropane fatty-acyl-phospholipid synthase-like methyltransferase